MTFARQIIWRSIVRPSRTLVPEQQLTEHDSSAGLAAGTFE